MVWSKLIVKIRTHVWAPSLPHCCLPLACDTTYKRDIKSNFCAKLKLIFVAERWSAKRYDIYWAVKNLVRRIGALIENEKRNIVAAGIKFPLNFGPNRRQPESSFLFDCLNNWETGWYDCVVLQKLIFLRKFFALIGQHLILNKYHLQVDLLKLSNSSLF